MAIAEYNEKAERYMQPGTSTFMKTSEAEAHNKSQSGGKETVSSSSGLGAIAGPIVASLRAEFKGLNTHLAFRFTDIKQAIIGGSAQEMRDDRISAGDTDKDLAIPKEKGGSFLESLKGLNPFKDGIGPKLTVFLLVGALAAISQFGDKLVKPLADFLKWADGDNPTEGLKAKVIQFRDFLQKETTEFLSSFDDLMESFKKMVTDIQVLTGLESWDDLMMAMGDMKARFQYVANDIDIEMQLFKQWWAPKWASFKNFFRLLEDMFEDIGDWVASYDVGGPEGKDKPDGILQKDELTRMVDDMANAVIEELKYVVSSIIKGITLAAFAWTATNALFIAPAMVAVKAFWTAQALTIAPLLGTVAGPAVAGGFMGIAGLALVVALGMWKLIDNTSTAFQAAILEAENSPDPDDLFDFSTFLSTFLSGDPKGDGKGGFFAGLQNAFDKALIGLGVGAALGLAGGPFAPITSLMGAIIGFITFAIGGFFLGDAGQDAVDAWFESTGDVIGDIIDTITGFFDRVFLRIKALFSFGTDTGQVMQAERRSRSVDTASNKIVENQRVIDNLDEQRKYIQNFKYGSPEGFQEALSQGNLMPADVTSLALYQEQISKRQAENALLNNALSSGSLATNAASGAMNLKSFNDTGTIGTAKYQQLSPEILKALGMKPIITTTFDGPDYNYNIDQYMMNGLGVDATEPNAKLILNYSGSSDIRLKEDIKLIGKSPSDINIYEFKYIGKEGVYEGVMAQEVPWATSVDDNGYLLVDYSKVDVEFKKLH